MKEQRYNLLNIQILENKGEILNMNCIKTEDNVRYTWAIKDSKGNFAHKGSIRKINKDTWQYISFKTFSQEARGYTSKESAEKALAFLNKKNDIAGFKFVFHIECLNLNKIIDENTIFQGKNMLIYEKEVVSAAYKMGKVAKTCVCTCLPTLILASII